MQIGHINLCDRPTPNNPTSTSANIPLTDTQQQTVTKLAALGLRAEQIADALNLPVEGVQQVLSD